MVNVIDFSGSVRPKLIGVGSGSIDLASFAQKENYKELRLAKRRLRCFVFAGVGRLIAESKKCPIVIPFWHVGMNNVLPNKEPYIPQWGQLVTILIGNPIDFTCLRSTMQKENKSAMEQRKKITDVIQDEFSQLKSQAETLHQLSLPSSSS